MKPSSETPAPDAAGTQANALPEQSAALSPQREVPRRIWLDPILIAGVALSAFLTWLALRNIPLSELTEAFRSMNQSVLLPAIALTYIIMWLRALRWRLLLLAVGNASRSQAFNSSVIGYMVNYIIPVRIGELVRAYLVATQDGFSRSSAFATVVVERLVDVFCVLLIFAGVSIAMDFSGVSSQIQAGIRSSALGFLVVGTLVIIGLWALRRHRNLLIRKLQSGKTRWHPLIGQQAWRIGVFADGIVFPKSSRLRLWFLCQTVAIWITTVGQVWILLDGFYFSLPWEASWLMLVALAVGVSLPSAPGLIGTFHYAIILVLRGFGVVGADAVSYAIVLHAVSVLPILALGIVMVWHKGLSFRELIRVRHSGPEAP